MTQPASLVAVLRHLDFIRETQGPNKGAWVEFLQRFCHGQPGDAWCAYLISVGLDIAYYGKPPLVRSGSCQVILNNAKAKGFLVLGPPRFGDLYFFLNSEGRAHHIGAVTAVNPFSGIAGNTSPDGLSSNGTGTFEHEIRIAPERLALVRLPGQEWYA